MSNEMEKQYSPANHERAVYSRWLREKSFKAVPDSRHERYVIMMPLPNVTGALHLGHAMDNVMQDLLTRWHRMQGHNTLWQPGTDHAGIATQAVVEKRLFELEGKTRHDLGREKLVQRIWAWKNEYQERIIRQQQAMGCGCDWDRQRFTMDPVCARAVREGFFRLFRDRLIFRGDRLINWDCKLQTAVSDDEIYYEQVKGGFYHLRYEVVAPQRGEPSHVVVATTRPETMLGDVAVAVHPDPRAALEAVRLKISERLAEASAKDHHALEAELAAIDDRIRERLPELITLSQMARAGRKIRLPLVGREIPLIVDEWAKPELGSGCVKITPAHDTNDYQVWLRHRDSLAIINILNPDGTLNARAGKYAGVSREAAREKVVADLKGAGALLEVEDRVIDLAHSDRSKTVIEPWLSKQWFIRMADTPEGVVCGRGTAGEFRSAGLAQAAIDATRDDWRSASGRRVQFFPDGDRYRKTYTTWLAEKRDWCISRQLWWGHQIPVWACRVDQAGKDQVEAALNQLHGRADVALSIERAEDATEMYDILVCLRDDAAEQALRANLERLGLARDPDVLDTWFSSALWPLSTLGWPSPENAAVEPGQQPLGPVGDGPDALSYYYPGSCLVTGRDIITLWVVRMVVFGLYFAGDVPFEHVFIHANILDGKGERMSKSKGNGIDPEDIIARYGTDAMRYILCDMQTGTQDIRLPVQAISPFTNEVVDLATAKHGRTIFSYLCPTTGKEFDVLGTLPDVPSAKVISDRFEVGSAFCNKLWNATRFVLMNCRDSQWQERQVKELPVEDRWILSRSAEVVAEVTKQLSQYNPSTAIGLVRDFFWNDLCDWYLEIIKQRLKSGQNADQAKQVLAFCLDQVLRLLHPFVPFITEVLWEKLREVAPERGIDTRLSNEDLLVTARWPVARDQWINAELGAQFDSLRALVRAIRDMRASYKIAPGSKLQARIKIRAERVAMVQASAGFLAHLTNLSSLEVGPNVESTIDAATSVLPDAEVYLVGAVDVAKERQRLNEQLLSVDQQIKSLGDRLNNPGFLAKAKPEVVAQQRSSLENLERERTRLSETLRRYS